MFPKSITRFFAIAPLFLIPLFVLLPTPHTPFEFANNLFFPFISGKGFYFRILAEVAFASWIILAFLDAKYRPKWNALTISVTVFAAVSLVADLVGVNPLRSLWSNFERMEGWITIVHLWMLYMVAVHTFVAENSKKLWHAWLNTSLVIAGIVAIYGFAQYFGWTAIHQSSSRVDASLGNSAYMAVYMLISAGFAVYLLLESRVRRAVKGFSVSVLEGVYLVATAAFIFLLIETSTRGTILGLVGGIIVALVVYTIFGKGASKLSRKVSGGIVVALILLGILFVTYRNAPFVQKYEPLQRLASISLSNTESVSRLYIWNMALTGFEQRPILGWGQENFNYVFNANYNPKMYNQEQWFDRAHNVYIDWLINGGLVGLLAYLALYVFFLLSVWKSTLSIAEKSALTGLLAGYAVHNIFVFDNLASYVLFFTLLGLGASLKKADTVKHSDGHVVASVATKPAREFGTDLIEYVVAPVAILALIFGVYWFNARPIQQNTRLITALQGCSSPKTLPNASLFTDALSITSYIGTQEIREQFLSCSGQVIASQQMPNTTKQAFFELSMKVIADQIKATPKDSRVYTLAGNFYEQIGAFSQALPLLEKAHELSPAKQSTDFALGTAYINLKQYDRAVTLLKQAYEEETANADAQTEYAVALISDGKDAEAQSLFGADSPIFQTEQAAQAYTLAKQYSKAITIYKAVIGTSTDQVNTQLRLAQTQYAAGLIDQAVATLKVIEKAHPEYATQLDAAIKQVTTGK
jgi:O-antigen ligase/thioredoxin-like negative regulator of GroEL